MSKSVYSIVLSDAVVAAIDEMACRLGTNRSNMINQILAEKLSYKTPEQHIKNILLQIEDIINNQDIFRVLGINGNSTLMLKSSFKYKYNPSVKYSVVLNKKNGQTYGEFRVLFRTQNECLLNELTNFIQIWVAFEKGYIKREIVYGQGKGKFERVLNLPNEDFDEHTLGIIISEYINCFDKIMKSYFSGEKIEKLEKDYVMFLSKSSYIL